MHVHTQTSCHEHIEGAQSIASSQNVPIIYLSFEGEL